MTEDEKKENAENGKLATALRAFDAALIELKEEVAGVEILTLDEFKNISSKGVSFVGFGLGGNPSLLAPQTGFEFLDPLATKHVDEKFQSESGDSGAGVFDI